MVSPKPLESEPEPTQDIVDLSGETTNAASDLQGPAAVSDEVVPESAPAEVDLRELESPGRPTEDLTVVREYIHVTFDALKVVKFRFGMGAKRLGDVVYTAVALCVLAVAGGVLILVAPRYAGPILLGCAGIAALLILLAWWGARGGRRDT